MTKPSKKIVTNDKSIDNAEQELDIKYPPIIRDRLKERNGFDWGHFRFFCVLDQEDKFHTFDDVVRENKSWKQYLPENQIAIASEDILCLTLSTKKDNSIYLYNHQTGELEVFAETDKELQQKLDAQEES
ncbi:SMI1/KNR4 family protein [Patescibacteria group bacterium]|nr:SMI1/KNR4 family protein [Patescibacteria group bacterium]MCG2702519.1 SMI1/KNR4 family protein [Candidatus Parcubacteria bacterium]MBU4265060.1 SMI1/KNR4 family protein [Patescibacteria group bacterium]MBU4390269.1 SMI1/KNR4 family protein [Patescibacteria group bacterium]MBU4397151.1 SMI1/KNR4 family protein [Patescibacteria group bacterium]